MLCHPTESEAIQSWRAGDDSGSKFDFIPSTASPPFWSPTGGELVGRQPTSAYENMEIIGQWGPCLIHESYFIPEHYVVVVATGGTGSPSNVIGLRSHSNPNYVGLRQIAGSAPYPLQESYYTHGFGTGVRHRGAAVVMQITDDPDYTVPTINV